jgi:hypothetical protein
MANEGKSSETLTDSSSEIVSADKLVHAVQYGDLSYVEKAVEKHKFSSDTVDHDGCSLLHWAAINARLEIIQYLVHKRANVNIVGGDNGEIPLQWAARQTHCAKIIDFFLAENANIHHKSVFGYDSLFLAVQAGNLHIVYLLLHHGANPNTTDLNQDTPLLWILKNKPGECIELIRILIKFGADPATIGSMGNAMHVLLSEAAQNLDYNIALILYESGGKQLTEGVNEKGLTPYRMTIETKNSRMMRFLFDAYVYTQFPKALPVILIALTMVCYFYSIHVLGAFYGIIADVALYLCISPLLQQTIMIANSRYSSGIAWGIILTVSSSYFVFLSSYYGRNMDYFVSMTLVMICYCLYKSTVTPPAALSTEDHDERFLLLFSSLFLLF